MRLFISRSWLLHTHLAQGPFTSSSHQTIRSSHARPSSSYRTIAVTTTSTTEVHHSKFVAIAFGNVGSPDTAMALIRSHSVADASHNCWAYKIGSLTRCSDDGEPSGTAGKPISSAILSEDFSHVLVLVTRFFGGTKLGTGGLSRAYGESARLCLRGAPAIVTYEMVTYEIGPLPYKDVALIYSLLKRWGGRRSGDESFDDVGNVSVALTIAAENDELFLSSLNDITCGKGNPRLKQ